MDYARLVYPYLEKEMKLANPMALRKLCRLAQVSRAGLYRWRKPATRMADPDLAVRDAIQHIALEFPCYGCRRMGIELGRRGWQVNRKRVQRLMREDNLLCLRRRRRFVLTTDSNHNLPVYPNLAVAMVLTRLDQLWVADITYIRLQAMISEDDRPVSAEHRVEIPVGKPMRVLRGRLQRHQVHDIHDADFYVGKILAQQIYCRENFEGGHVAGAGHYHVRFGVLIGAGPGPNADSIRAVLNGRIHVEPLQGGLLASHNHVYVMAAAQAAICH